MQQADINLYKLCYAYNKTTQFVTLFIDFSINLVMFFFQDGRHTGMLIWIYLLEMHLLHNAA